MLNKHDSLPENIQKKEVKDYRHRYYGCHSRYQNNL